MDSIFPVNRGLRTTDEGKAPDKRRKSFDRSAKADQV